MLHCRGVATAQKSHPPSHLVLVVLQEHFVFEVPGRYINNVEFSDKIPYRVKVFWSQITHSIPDL